MCNSTIGFGSIKSIRNGQAQNVQKVDGTILCITQLDNAIVGSVTDYNLMPCNYYYHYYYYHYHHYYYYYYYGFFCGRCKLVVSCLEISLTVPSRNHKQLSKTALMAEIAAAYICKAVCYLMVVGIVYTA